MLELPIVIIIDILSNFINVVDLTNFDSSLTNENLRSVIYSKYYCIKTIFNNYPYTRQDDKIYNWLISKNIKFNYYSAVDYISKPNETLDFIRNNSHMLEKIEINYRPFIFNAETYITTQLFLVELISNCTNLKYIALCGNMLNDEMIINISKYLNKLQTLILIDCMILIDTIKYVINSCCKNLIILNICGGIIGIDLKPIVSQCINLKKINIFVDKLFITYDDVYQLIITYPNLNISFNDFTTPHDLLKIINHCYKHNKNIIINNTFFMQ